ncbi:MAG: hypothetical protein ACOCZD_00240 [Haloferacaceae archaeon]
MSFSEVWTTVREVLEALPTTATFHTPRSRRSFRVVDSQRHRIVIERRDTGACRPLDRAQFETLYERVRTAADGYDLDRLPADAEPYATILSLHPGVELDRRANTLVEREAPSPSPLVESDPSVLAVLEELGAADPAALEAAGEGADASRGIEGRGDPDLPVYADMLLLLDALERHDVGHLDGLATGTLVDLYTLCSDVQRNANELRRSVRAVLLDRLDHDRAVHGQFGSVRRTSRRNRSLKDEETVLSALTDAGVDPDAVRSLDAEKVDDALAVTDLDDEDVYEVETSDYVRKAEVDTDVKQSRLQGLSDRLTETDRAERAELRREIEALEARIEELTSFKPGVAFRGADDGVQE